VVRRARSGRKQVAVGARPRLLALGADRALATRVLPRYEYVVPTARSTPCAVGCVARRPVPTTGFERAVGRPRAGSRFSIGANEGSSRKTATSATDLRRERVLRKRAFPTGTDRPRIRPRASALPFPTAERTLDRRLFRRRRNDGDVAYELRGAGLAHRHRRAGRGSRIFLGRRSSRYLAVGSDLPRSTTGRAPTPPGAPRFRPPRCHGDATRRRSPRA
jgi:hypothetical protein